MEFWKDCIYPSINHMHQSSGNWLDNVIWESIELPLDGSVVIMKGVSEEEFETSLKNTKCTFCSELLSLCFLSTNCEVVIEMSESRSHAIGAPAFEDAIRDRLEELGVPYSQRLSATGIGKLWDQQCLICSISTCRVSCG
jgi:hypothetical protein